MTAVEYNNVLQAIEIVRKYNMGFITKGSCFRVYDSKGCFLGSFATANEFYNSMLMYSMGYEDAKYRS